MSDDPLQVSAEPTRLTAIGAQDLNDLDAGEVRRRAITELVDSSGAAAVPELVEALADTDWRVRREAASLLATFDAALVTDRLIVALRSEDAGLRNAAMKALIKNGEDSLEALLGALQDEDPDVRIMAAVAIGQIGSNTATVALLETLGRETDSNVSYMIVEALGRVGDNRALPMLIAMLEGEAWLAAAAARALGDIGSVEATEHLLSHLEDDIVGGVAAEALGMIGDLRALVPMYEVARQLSGTAVHTFAKAMGSLLENQQSAVAGLVLALRRHTSDPSSALLDAAGHLIHAGSVDDAQRGLALASWLDDLALIEPVCRSLDDADTSMQASAILERWWPEMRGAASTGTCPSCKHAATLGVIARAGEAQDAPTVAVWLDDSNPSTRRDALVALRSLKAVGFASRAIALVEDPVDDVRVEAAITAAALDPTASFEPIEPLITGAEEQDRWVAAAFVDQAVRSHHGEDEQLDRQLLEAARALVHDPSPAVRAASIFALGKLDETSDVLLELTSDENAQARTAAIGALGTRGELEARTALRTLAADEDVRTALAALRALAAEPAHMESDLLLGALDHDDIRIRIAALRGLAHLCVRSAEGRIAALLEDDVPDVREAALIALSTCSPSLAGQKAADLMCDESWQVRAAAVSLLALVPISQRRLMLMDALRDPVSAVRRAGASRADLAGPDAIDLLVQALHDDEVVEAAAEALATLGPQAVNRAVRLLDGCEGTGCLSLVAATDVSEDAELRGVVMEQARSNQSYRRWMATAAISSQADGSWTEFLADLRATESNESVRWLLDAVLEDLEEVAS